ncbi:MAG: Na/Pi cotransporter family protein, partial [Oscillospiraceae bacterium]|nr:Na/Pi cotransporter family protein [Oscillospiraceae bacterium]
GAMEPLKESPAFLAFIAAVSNPFVAILVGIVVTAVIQSCSASIGILQALSITGVIGYDVALPMVIGMCIGACAPVLLSALSANVNGKRTAAIYLIFNVTGAVILLVPFYILHGFMEFAFMGEMATSMGIAIVNTIFKVGATLLLMPFAGLLNKLVVLIVHDKSSKEEAKEESLLDPLLLPYPSLALEQCRRAMAIMSNAALENLKSSIGLMTTYDEDLFEAVRKGEDVVDSLEDRIGDYIVKLNAKELEDAETRVSSMFLTSIGNVERISDHAVNISELAQELHDKKLSFSDRALQSLDYCLKASLEIAELTLRDEYWEDPTVVHRITALEEVMDVLTKELKAGHIHRVQSGHCTLELGFIFNDLLNNLERVSDHCANIAIAVQESKDEGVNAHEYMSTLNRKDRMEYKTQLQRYLKKYHTPLHNEGEM